MNINTMMISAHLFSLSGTANPLSGTADDIAFQASSLSRWPIRYAFYRLPATVFWRDGTFDPLHLRGAELDVERAEGLVEAVALADAD